jgi:hypothetical protein
MAWHEHGLEVEVDAKMLYKVSNSRNSIPFRVFRGREE